MRRHTHTDTIEVGKYAGLAIFDMEDCREIPYYIGVNCCVMTVMRGEVVYCRERT